MPQGISLQLKVAHAKMGSGREEGMEAKEREEKKKRQRGRQGARFTDSNEIIEEVREWASEGAEQKDKKKKCRREDCDFSGTDTGLWM